MPLKLGKQTAVWLPWPSQVKVLCRDLILLVTLISHWNHLLHAFLLKSFLYSILLWDEKRNSCFIKWKTKKEKLPSNTVTTSVLMKRHIFTFLTCFHLAHVMTSLLHNYIEVTKHFMVFLYFHKYFVDFWNKCFSSLLSRYANNLLKYFSIFCTFMGSLTFLYFIVLIILPWNGFLGKCFSNLILHWPPLTFVEMYSQITFLEGNTILSCSSMAKSYHLNLFLCQLITILMLHYLNMKKWYGISFNIDI